MATALAAVQRRVAEGPEQHSSLTDRFGAQVAGDALVLDGLEAAHGKVPVAHVKEGEVHLNRVGAGGHGLAPQQPHAMKGADRQASQRNAAAHTP